MSGVPEMAAWPLRPGPISVPVLFPCWHLFRPGPLKVPVLQAYRSVSVTGKVFVSRLPPVVQLPD